MPKSTVSPGLITARERPSESEVGSLAAGSTARANASLIYPIGKPVPALNLVQLKHRINN